MLQLALYGLLAIVVAAVLFLLAARFLPAGEQIAPSLRDEPPWELPPERQLTAQDIDSVRLPVALRGYRFAETDILLDRLASELSARDAEILRLRNQLAQVSTGRRSVERREASTADQPPSPGTDADPADRTARAEDAPDSEPRYVDPPGLDKADPPGAGTDA